MLNAAMLGLMERIALDIMVLTDEIGEEDFFNSRLTKVQTLQLLASLAHTVVNLPADTRERMHEIDWAAWLLPPGNILLECHIWKRNSSSRTEYAKAMRSSSGLSGWCPRL
ncbi:MAG: hypothetical protein HZB47_14470 [Nitrosomonadales bacterium]|nr:hypothetical protein [Nitrosomonadales bacterium]